MFSNSGQPTVSLKNYLDTLCFLTVDNQLYLDYSLDFLTVGKLPGVGLVFLTVDNLPVLALNF
jgi:hypothetical protein